MVGGSKLLYDDSVFRDDGMMTADADIMALRVSTALFFVFLALSLTASSAKAANKKSHTGKPASCELHQLREKHKRRSH